MEFDQKDYLEHLANLDLDEAEKLALIDALWRIAQMFVDAAFDDVSQDSCEHRPEITSASDVSNVINFPTIAKPFRSAANDNAALGKKQGAA